MAEDDTLLTGWKKAVDSFQANASTSTRSGQLPEGQPLRVSSTGDVHWIIEDGSEDADPTDPIMTSGDHAEPVVAHTSPLYISAIVPAGGSACYVSVAARHLNYT